MRRLFRRVAVRVVGLMVLTGCNPSPYLPPPPTAAAWQQTPAQTPAPNPAEMYDLNRRATALDANNRDLHAQLAQSRQQVQLLQQQVSLLQKQLSETAQRLQQTQVAKEESERKLEALQASTTRRGGAIITANSNSRASVRLIEIPGLNTRQDGDTIRVTLPADQLFPLGAAQLIGTAFPVLDALAAELARNYPRQLIAIEGHTDNSPVAGGISSHQLAAAQTIAVFDALTRRNRLPMQQFYVVAQGPNRPAASNATQAGQTANRRIELVVFPQTIDAP
ncbi:MAG TPA: OmpA family protein [Candidatus Anammoximicrobium sp.]|nr:OmpA family protein [Candidatus Anammoximicrobium sp.]